MDGPLGVSGSLVMVVIVVPVAAVSYVFEFVAAFFSLPAVFSMLFDGDAQIVFGPVNISLTFPFRARGQG